MSSASVLLSWYEFIPATMYGRGHAATREPRVPRQEIDLRKSKMPVRRLRGDRPPRSSSARRGGHHRRIALRVNRERSPHLERRHGAPPRGGRRSRRQRSRPGRQQARAARLMKKPTLGGNESLHARPSRERGVRRASPTPTSLIIPRRGMTRTRADPAAPAPSMHMSTTPGTWTRRALRDQARARVGVGGAAGGGCGSMYFIEPDDQRAARSFSAQFAEQLLHSRRLAVVVHHQRHVRGASERPHGRQLRASHKPGRPSSPNRTKTPSCLGTSIQNSRPASSERGMPKVHDDPLPDRPAKTVLRIASMIRSWTCPRRLSPRERARMSADERAHRLRTSSAPSLRESADRHCFGATPPQNRARPSSRPSRRSARAPTSASTPRRASAAPPSTTAARSARTRRTPAASGSTRRTRSSR